MRAAQSIHPSSRRLRGVRRVWLVLGAAALLLMPTFAAPVAANGSHQLGDATVISSWNALAEQTFRNDPGKKPQETFLYLGFVNAAIYDAVVGIDGRYEPYGFWSRPPRGASDQAAAVAAAYRILSTYSPYAQGTLDAAYAASLMPITNGPAKSDGIAYGFAVADHVVQTRMNDGRNANVQFTKPLAPGVWRPTPPGNLAMFVPWMGSVTPLLVEDGAQFGEPGDPPSLTSRRYTRDFNEVATFGSLGSTARTADQTALALFFSGNASIQYMAALVDQAKVRHLDIIDAARMFVAVDMSIADAIISVWHAKLLYGFWRPITAIQMADTDGNPDTAKDANWTPLLITPPYPDYVSGYSGVTGAFTRSLARTLRTRDLKLTLISSAVPNVTKTYHLGRSLDDDVISARVWLGIHFRTADTAGVRMGQQVADWGLDHYFRRISYHDN